MKLITVFGATGAQGGGVVDALLKDGSYKIRGVTRHVDSSKAKSLVSKGVEMVAADFSNPETLSKAVEVSWFISVISLLQCNSVSRERRQSLQSQTSGTISPTMAQ